MARKNWLQIDLRTILLLTAIVSLSVGWWSNRQSLLRQQEDHAGIAMLHQRVITDVTGPYLGERRTEEAESSRILHQIMSMLDMSIKRHRELYCDLKELPPTHALIGREFLVDFDINGKSVPSTFNLFRLLYVRPGTNTTDTYQSNFSAIAVTCAKDVQWVAIKENIEDVEVKDGRDGQGIKIVFKRSSGLNAAYSVCRDGIHVLHD